MKREELTLIGTCTAVHGIKGEVQCAVSNPIFDEVDFDYLVVEIDGTYIPFYVEEYRWKSNNVVLVKFVDINTQKDAQQLLHHDFYIESQFIDSSDNSISLSDVELLDGYEIEAIGRGIIGKVVNTDFITPENAILLLDNGLIIPLHPDLVDNLNREGRTLTMTIPDGLLE